MIIDSKHVNESSSRSPVNDAKYTIDIEVVGGNTNKSKKDITL